MTDGGAVRRREARRAARVLDVDSLEFWKHPDGKLAGSRDLPGQLKELLARERPDLVYLPFGGDAHADHQALAKAYDKAVRRAPSPPREARYEIWSMMKRARAADISRVFEDKLEALRQYRSQLRAYDYVAQVRRLNTARAMLLPRARFAEAFEIY